MCSMLRECLRTWWLATGPSEWYYAPIPFFASLAGGAAGAGMFMLINLLNASNVSVPDVFV